MTSCEKIHCRKKPKVIAQGVKHRGVQHPVGPLVKLATGFVGLPIFDARHVLGFERDVAGNTPLHDFDGESSEVDGSSSSLFEKIGHRDLIVGANEDVGAICLGGEPLES